MLPHQNQHEVTTTTRAAALTPTTSHPLAYVGSDPGSGPGQVPTSGVLLQNSSSTRQPPQPNVATTTTVPAGPAPASAPVPGFAPTIFSVSTTAPTTVSSSSATATKTASTLRPPSPPSRTLPRRLISFCRRVVQRIRPPPVRISSYYYPQQRGQSLDADAALGETTAGASTLASASVIMSPNDTGGKRRPNTAMPMPGASASSSSSRSAAAGVAAAAAAGGATSSKMSFSLGDRVTKPSWPSPPVSPGTATATGGTAATAVGAPLPTGSHHNTNTTAHVTTPSSPTTSSSWSRRRWFSLASPAAIGKRASTSAGLDTTTAGTSDHEAESGTRTSASTSTTHHSSPVRTLPGGGAEFAAWFAPPPRPFVARPMAYINTNGSASPYGDLGNGGDAQWNIEVDPEPLLRRRRFHAGESITGESASGARPVAGAHSSTTPVGSATNSRESGRSHGHDQLGNGYANGSTSTIWPSTPRTMDSAASSVTTLFVNGGGSSGLSGGGHGGCGASICSTQHPSSIYTTTSNGTNGGKQRTTRSAGNGRPRTPVSAPATANANATTPVLPRSGSLSTTTSASPHAHAAPSSAGGLRNGVGHSNSAASLLTTQTSLTACTASATVAAQRRQTVPRMDSRSLNEATTREQQRYRREQQQHGQQNSHDGQEQQHRGEGQQRHHHHHHHHHHHQHRQEAQPHPRYDGQPPQHQQTGERRPKQRPHRPRPQVNTGPLTMPASTSTTSTTTPHSAAVAGHGGGSESQRRRASLRPRSPTLSDIYRDLHISPARSRARMVDLDLNLNLNGGAGLGVGVAEGAEGEGSLMMSGAVTAAARAEGDANGSGSAEPARRNGSASAPAAGKGWW